MLSHRLIALGLTSLLQLPIAMADVKPLPPSQWPNTADAAVPLVLAVMSPTQKFIISDTPKENLFLFQGEWGDDIEHLLGLNDGNTALVTAACGKPCSVDQATLSLMEKVWETLRNTR